MNPYRIEPTAERRHPVRVEPVEEHGDVGPRQLDLAERRGVHRARGPSHREAFARDGGVQILGRARPGSTTGASTGRRSRRSRRARRATRGSASCGPDRAGSGRDRGRRAPSRGPACTAAGRSSDPGRRVPRPTPGSRSRPSARRSCAPGRSRCRCRSARFTCSVERRSRATASSTSATVESRCRSTKCRDRSSAGVNQNGVTVGSPSPAAAPTISSHRGPVPSGRKHACASSYRSPPLIPRQS